jgi:hypothetical protein
VTEQRDRAFAFVVDVREPAAVRLRSNRGLDANTEVAKLSDRAASDLVVADRRHEQRLARQPSQPHRCHASAAARLRPDLARGHDAAGLRHARDAQELDPLEMTDYGDLHGRQSHTGTVARV